MDNQTTAFRLSKLITPFLPMWLGVWLLGIVSAVSAVGLLFVSGWFMTMAGLSVAVGVHSLSHIVLGYFAPSALIRNFAFLRTGGRYGELLLSHYAIFEVLKRLRVHFFGEFAKLSPKDRQKVGSSTAQYRLVKDIDVLSDFALRFMSPWVVVSCVVLLASFVFFWSVQLPPVLLATAILVVVPFVCYAKKFVAQASNIQEKRQVVLLNALPVLTQLTLWQKWQTVIEDIGKMDNELSDIYKRQSQHNQWVVFVSQGVLIVAVLGALYLGAVSLAGDKGVSVAVLLAVVFGLFALMEVLGAITADVSALARSTLAKERLNGLLSTNKPTALQSMPDGFDIYLQELSVYQAGAVFGLDDVNVRIRQGVPLVISGVSGGGKSTLLQALAGELPLKSGQIVLDGNDKTLLIDEIDWQGQLGFLGQQVDIFDQTLAQNLRLGKPSASDDELWSVLELVGLKDWASLQPEQLSTPLGEYGMAVSGGQARRIALARLLLSSKKVLLLDEPFAGLDEQNRKQLWQQLIKWQKTGILVIVSHHQLDGVYDTLVIGK